jgi:hypothetical protein
MMVVSDCAKVLRVSGFSGPPSFSTFRRRNPRMMELGSLIETHEHKGDFREW